MKWERREEIRNIYKKTIVYIRGGSSARASLEIWEHHQVPHPQENALGCMCIREPPLQHFNPLIW
jgi:hypothetical protein